MDIPMSAQVRPQKPPFIQHGISVKGQELTIDEALDKCGLNFEVGTADTLFSTGESTYKVPSSKVIYRTDKNIPLGLVSDKYKPISNSEIFGWIEPLVGKKDCCVEAGGYFNDGGNVYLSLKLPTTILIGGVDPVEKYVNIIGNHSGKGGVQIALSPIRLFCQNQLQAIIRDAKKAGELINISHRGNVVDKIDEAVRALNFVNTKYEEVALQFQSINKKMIADKEISRYICKSVLSPSDLATLIGNVGTAGYEYLVSNQRHLIDYTGLSVNKANECKGILDYYHSSKFGQEDIKGTLWGAYNAITGYYNNEVHFSSSEKRLLSNGSLNTGNGKKMVQALEMALEW